MKKDYLKPETLVVDVVCETIIATSPGDIVEGEDNQDPGPGDVGKHRGEWGNVWAK